MHALRRLLLALIINAGAVAVTAALIPGISYTGGVRSLAIIAVVFGAVNLIIRPVLSVFSLPIEIATIGLFSVVINAAMLLLVTRLVSGFTILPFPFPGFRYGSFILAPVMLPAWGTAILGAVIIGTLITTLSWLTKGK